MTDRELLELAAKAAGLVVHWGSAWQEDTLFREIPRPSSPLVANIEWNPLTDDGDALKLAVKLNIRVNPGENGDACADWWLASDPTILKVVYEDHGTDPYAATRRAITRAAAEIGRGK